MALMLSLVSVFRRVSACLILVSAIFALRICLIRVLVLLRRRLLFGLQRKQDLRSAETTAIASLLSEFLSLHRSWSEKMLELETERVRLERLRLEGSQPLSDVPLGQLRVSEDEQDADWALKHGIISPQEYNDLLAATGLAPADLEFE